MPARPRNASERRSQRAVVAERGRCYWAWTGGRAMLRPPTYTNISGGNVPIGMRDAGSLSSLQCALAHRVRSPFAGSPHPCPCVDSVGRRRDVGRGPGRIRLAVEVAPSDQLVDLAGVSVGGAA
jgi:hypothetical protein